MAYLLANLFTVLQLVLENKYLNKFSLYTRSKIFQKEALLKRARSQRTLTFSPIIMIIKKHATLLVQISEFSRFFCIMLDHMWATTGPRTGFSPL